MADREVVFTMKGLIDPSTIESMRRVGQTAKTTQDEIERVEVTTGEKRRARWNEEELAYRRSKQMQAQAAKEEGRVIDQFYAEEDARAMNRNRTTTAAFDREQHERTSSLQRNIQIRIREEEQAANRLKYVMESTAARVQRANFTIISSSRVVLRGLASIGFGLGELGLLSEDYGEKMVKNLLKLHAAYNLLRGGISLIQGLSRMWVSYEAAVKAAAVAHELLAAAQAKTAVFGAAAAVGVGAGTNAGAAAGAGAGAAAVAGPSIVGALIPGVAAGLYTAGILAGSAKMSWELGESVQKHGLGGGADPGSWVDYMGSGFYNPFGWMVAPTQKWSAWGSAARTGRLEGGLKQTLKQESQREHFESAEIRLRVAEQTHADKWTPPDLNESYQRVWGTGARKDPTELRVHNVETFISLSEKASRQQEQADAKQLANAQKYLKELEKQYEQHIKNVQKLREQFLSAEVKLALSSPAEQARAAVAIRAAREGIATRSQYKEALEYMSPAEKERTERQLVQRGLIGGMRGIISPEWQREIRDEEAAATETAGQVTTQTQMMERVQRQAEQNAKLLADEITNAMRLMGELQLQALRKELNKLAGEQSSRQVEATLSGVK